MSTGILLKKSSVSGKVPQPTDLNYGEIALNYADGLLYFKNSSNTIQSFTSNLSSYVTLTGTQTLTNKTLSSPTLTGAVTAGGSTGTAGQYLQTTGTGVQWANIATGISYTLVNSNTTAVSGQGYLANTIGGSFTITLPASPQNGNYVVIADDANFNSNNLTIAGNGSSIDGYNANLVADVAGVAITLVFDGTTWKVYAQVGATAGYTNTFNVPTATNSNLGIVQPDGTTITINSGVISAANQSFQPNGVTNITANNTTTTLTVSTAINITVSGNNTQIIKLPDATTLKAGWIFRINNNTSSASSLTINNNGGGQVGTVPQGGDCQVILLDNSTTNGSWDFHGWIPSNLLMGSSVFQLGSSSYTIGPYNSALSIGTSTAATTYNFGTGATLSGNTKTINIGTGGASGSTTVVNIGSSNSSSVVLSGLISLNYTGAGSTSTLNLAGYNSKGGTGYHDFLVATNGYGSASNPNKWFRIDSTGSLQVINSAYSTTLFSLTDTGDLGINGSITMPNRPAFRVYGGGTTAINATNTLTSSNWVVDYQQGSNLNGSTGIFTAPLAGLYQVNLVARWGGSANTSAIQVQKTSGGTTTTQVYLEWGGNSTAFHYGGSAVVKLAANDTLKVTVTSGTVTFDANDCWSVAFIG